MIRNLVAAGLILALVSCSPDNRNKEESKVPDFTFAFMTDIHLKPEMGAIKGFQMAIDSVNELRPDFVITGGDLIDDALYASQSRADSLYELYNSMIKGFNMPVYNTMGNHEHYGYGANPPVDPGHPDFGNGMYERHIGSRYYSFDHQGWHFIILESTQKGEGESGSYIGGIDQKQLEWIREDLNSLDPSTPIVVVTHIPLVSIQPQIIHGPAYADTRGTLITNQQEVLAPFREMNLKLVLQGHLHFLEEITLLEQTRFITGGAVAGQWWRTPDDSPLQEGFLMVRIEDDDISWRYVDYGWETGISVSQESVE